MPFAEHDVVALRVRRPEAVDAACLRSSPARSRRGARARSRRARGRPRRPGRRGSRGSVPSAPRRGRRTSSRCTRAAWPAAGSTTRAPVNAGVGEVVGAPLDRRPVRARRGEREERLALLLAVELAQLLLLGAVLVVEPHAPLGLEQVGDDADDARGVEDVQRRLRRTRARSSRRCAARDVVAPPIRSGRSSPRRSISSATCTISSSDGRDQAGEPDDVAALLHRRVEDAVGRAP